LKIAIDINVVLDVFLERKPHDLHSKKLIAECLDNSYQPMLSALSFATIYYLIRKFKDRNVAVKVIDDLLLIFEVFEVNMGHIKKAHLSNWNDFEDAIQYYSSVAADADVLVTRNVKDFEEPEIPVLTPKQALKIIQKK